MLGAYCTHTSPIVNQQRAVGVAEGAAGGV